jgi:hypothetical protein
MCMGRARSPGSVQPSTALRDQQAPSCLVLGYVDEFAAMASVPPSHQNMEGHVNGRTLSRH